MDLANAPWKGIYPPGLAPDAKPDVYPVHDIVDRVAAERDNSETPVVGRKTSFVGMFRSTGALPRWPAGNHSKLELKQDRPDRRRAAMASLNTRRLP
ncbi:MAG: hypothetical protein JJ864_02205 [Rhizobiaceae bacterium]|nr:hypothetical protein [Rhizobiaceae bacterium]